MPPIPPSPSGPGACLRLPVTGSQVPPYPMTCDHCARRHFWREPFPRGEYWPPPSTIGSLRKSNVVMARWLE